MKKTIDLLKETLSYTEIQSIKDIFTDFKEEKVVIASELSKANSRATTVHALKMLKVAGVIDTKSLGMKGTYIKVLDQDTIDKLLRG